MRTCPQLLSCIHLILLLSLGCNLLYDQDKKKTKNDVYHNVMQSIIVLTRSAGPYYLKESAFLPQSYVLVA